MTHVRSKFASLRVLTLGLLPLCLAAKSDGCGGNSTNLTSAVPDLSGAWSVTHDDTLEVTLRIGTGVYQSQIGPGGGMIEVDYQGDTLVFDLDCERPEVVCPREAWPEEINIQQRSVQFENRIIVTLPQQECSVPLVTPNAEECGRGTLNPNCEDVCEGAIFVREREHFGVVGDDGTSFRLYLGAGLVTSGVNCALLGVSLADAEIVSTGESSEEWRAESMRAGLVTVAYGGACLWAGEPELRPELQALVAGASLEFSTGFTGARQN